MNHLEQHHLMRYCRKYGLDYQEIDNSLTYWENKKHLQSLMRMLSRSLDVFEIARMEELQKQYIADHPLEYYMSYRMNETKSHNVKKAKPLQFSLKTKTAIGFSLQHLLQQKT